MNEKLLEIIDSNAILCFVSCRKARLERRAREKESEERIEFYCAIKNQEAPIPYTEKKTQQTEPFSTQSDLDKLKWRVKSACSMCVSLLVSLVVFRLFFFCSVCIGIIVVMMI